MGMGVDASPPGFWTAAVPCRFGMESGQHRTSNAQHRTSNVPSLRHSMFDVRRFFRCVFKLAFAAGVLHMRKLKEVILEIMKSNRLKLGRLCGAVVALL